MGEWVTDLATEWMKAVVYNTAVSERCVYNTPTPNLYRPVSGLCLQQVPKYTKQTVTAHES